MWPFFFIQHIIDERGEVFYIKIFTFLFFA